MTQADSVHSTPPTNTSAPNQTGLARQQRERAKALRRLGKLKLKAEAEIERLIGFLDAIDPFATELEHQVDDGPCDTDELEPSLCGVNASYIPTHNPWDVDLEGEHDGREPQEDDEDGLDCEPNLGSGAVYANSSQAQWAQPGTGTDDREEDAGDDREEENEHCDGHAEYEPSLGWTVDGAIQNTGGTSFDAELQDHFTARPQNRTQIKGPQISSEQPSQGAGWPDR